MMQYYNRKEYLYLRRKLRRQEIKCEEIMWAELRKRRVGGFYFRRQFGIGRYIVDFYCAKLKLVIEIDGATHSTKKEKEHDRVRQEFIESLGIKVIRFWNREVYNDLNRVVEKIYLVCLGRDEPLPGSLLGKERERI